ncbi:MAG: hypothetical protein COA50_07150 [Flavobacteriaceae bacterium]|nr:MAG: hypothetical protein COA50_07150 [Flavobacteriaceae bacterium]
MNTYIKISILFLTVAFTSCTDVIEVDLQTAASRLTIEASLDWEKGTAGNEQSIKLCTSTPFYDTTTNTNVTGASVKVVNTTNMEEFVFVDQNNGMYSTTSFIPIVNQSYTLEIVYDGETYTATETLMPVVDISTLTQSTEDGFDDEALEVNISFIDPIDEENYYLLRFKERDVLLVELFDFDDEFTNGNEVKLFYEKEEDEDGNTEGFVPGDTVDISLLGISEAYYNYISILIEQSEDEGPFGTTPVPLKGNCLNLNTPKNYAHGYFRLTQVVKDSYTFE